MWPRANTVGLKIVGASFAGERGTEKPRVNHCNGWNHLRLQLENKVMLMEHMASCDSELLLWEREIVTWNNTICHETSYNKGARRGSTNGAHTENATCRDT